MVGPYPEQQHEGFMKILIVRIGKMGDMAMVLPAIRLIQTDYPHASFYALTSEEGLKLLPFVGIQKDHIQIYRSKILYRLREAGKIKRWLSQNEFAHIFCFETKKRYRDLLPKHAQLLKNQSDVQHYAHRCLDLVSPFTHQTISYPEQAYLSVPLEQQTAIADLLRLHAIRDRTLVVGFHPTYSGFGKKRKKKETLHRQWSLQNFAQLSIRLTQYAKEQNIDLKIVMNLLPHEWAYGQDLVKQSGNTIILLSLAGGFSYFLAYLHRLNGLIVGNTGILHLAAALNTPLVALFSGYSPKDCGPYMSSQRHAVLCAEEISHPETGIQAITVEHVFQKTINLLNIIALKVTARNQEKLGLH